MAEKPEKLVVDVQVPVDYTYNYRIGPYLEKYIKGLGEKKILGVTCPECNKVPVPPRKICGACNRVLDEWVEVGPAGTVKTTLSATSRSTRDWSRSWTPPSCWR